MGHVNVGIYFEFNLSTPRVKLRDKRKKMNNIHCFTFSRDFLRMLFFCALSVDKSDGVCGECHVGANNDLWACLCSAALAAGPRMACHSCQSGGGGGAGARKIRGVGCVRIICGAAGAYN